MPRQWLSGKSGKRKPTATAQWAGQPVLPVLAGFRGTPARCSEAGCIHSRPPPRRPGCGRWNRLRGPSTRTGLPLGGADQRCGLAQRGDHLVLAIHPAVEVASSTMNATASALQRRDPGLQRRQLRGQLLARRGGGCLVSGSRSHPVFRCTARMRRSPPGRCSVMSAPLRRCAGGGPGSASAVSSGGLTRRSEALPACTTSPDISCTTCDRRSCGSSNGRAGRRARRWRGHRPPGSRSRRR